MTQPVVFGLVHGGMHGAWCWQRTIDALERRGHRAVAMDLPCGDEAAGASEYADVVVAALRDIEGPVILVGHSIGGLTLPVVATRRSVSRMIFLSALLPVPGRSLADQRIDEPDMSFPYRSEPEQLRARFFQTSSRADTDYAMAMMRGQAGKPFTEITPLATWPDVPSDYIVCELDRAVNPAWSVRASRNRLGVEPVILGGSDHSPFLGRADELAGLLLHLATRAATASSAVPVRMPET